ncbi:MAG: ABC transporter ATP-binding protein [Gemmatimonadetes bacterium]|nr:ABC transporter ATP-binding protein [Gemmatimonadota bacterium]
MIEVRELRKVLAGRVVLEDVSFSVPRGSVTAFLGPNGAGKSTTLRILAGATAPTSGSVTIDGRDVRRGAARDLVGWQPEHPPTASGVRVGEYLAFVGRVRGVRDLDGEIRAELSSVGLAGREPDRVDALSKGERVRVGLAAARLGDPPVLLLDEPTSGLDPGQLAGIRNLLERERGRRTVLLSTHLLPEAAALCDRVVLLHRGRVVASGRPEDLRPSGRRLRVLVRGDEERVRRTLTEVAGVRGVEEVSRDERGLALLVACDADVDPRAPLAAALVSAGVDVLELGRAAGELEQAFLELVAAPEPAR